ncbi:MAG TPA: 2OG-Fe(II) oxygenase, partial [Rhodocyclaceae bacterium]|nr:2OG-Fe(II) oxygenase [Rhodocyclaceae bacterium]
SITTELTQILATIQRPGDFYAHGAVEIFTPHLAVEGVGAIALPLLKQQAEQLVANAERAPYGRGEETRIDTEVRRTWQIDAAKVEISGKHWAQTLQSIVADAARQLGVTGAVNAALYKMLVYDECSFFVSHRDTEKVDGMFATLVIVLPSTYTGGELLVRHQEREVRLDMRCNDPSEARYAAFYADCVHEVLPVTTGCRLTLIYNLLRQGKDAAPQPPTYRLEQERLARLLTQWGSDDGSGGEMPRKLIYLLEHAYTPAESSLESLKGADAAVTPVLMAAAQSAQCEMYLALLSISESGSAEYVYHPRSRRSYYGDEPDEFEVGEVYERSAALTDWRALVGPRPVFAQLPFDNAEICPPGALDDLDEDDVEFHEATGNEGASFERTYHRAVLVLWPRRQRLAVMGQAGVVATLPYLASMTEEWLQQGGDMDAPSWREAQQLSEEMLKTWPTNPWGYGKENDNATLLDLLRRLKNPVTIERFMTEVSAAGIYRQMDNEALLQAGVLLPMPRFAELIGRISEVNLSSCDRFGRASHNALSACAELLRRSLELPQADEYAKDFIAAAKSLMAAMPSDIAVPAVAVVAASSGLTTKPVFPATAEMVLDLLRAFARLDAASMTELSAELEAQVLASPRAFDLDATVVPAAMAAMGYGVGASLRQAARRHLAARIAAPLAPPTDWRRDHLGVACTCAPCGELRDFLADAQRKSWAYKAPEALRKHMADSIRRSGCDLDMSTDKNTRPSHSLVCVKNRASYAFRVEQREADVRNLARLEA